MSKAMIIMVTITFGSIQIVEEFDDMANIILLTQYFESGSDMVQCLKKQMVQDPLYEENRCALSQDYTP